MKSVLLTLAFGAAFILGTIFPGHASASQTVQLSFLPPTDDFGTSTFLTSGFVNHPPDTISLDWDSTQANEDPYSDRVYARYIGVSQDTAATPRAVFRLSTLGDYYNCTNVIWLDIFSAQSGAWMQSVGYVHMQEATQQFTSPRTIYFKNGAGQTQPGIYIGNRRTYQQGDTCGWTAPHVHETHCACAGTGATVTTNTGLYNFDPQEPYPTYSNSSSANWTRRFSWTVTPNADVQHRLVAYHSGKCLEPSGTTAGSQIVQWTCSSGRVGQQVAVVDLQNGYYAIVFMAYNLCAGVTTASSGEGVTLKTCNLAVGGSKIEWTGSFPYNQIAAHSNHYSGLTMDIAGASQVNGAWLIQYPWSGGQPNEYFKKY
jgi:hypothetical protein